MPSTPSPSPLPLYLPLLVTDATAPEEAIVPIGVAAEGSDTRVSTDSSADYLEITRDEDVTVGMDSSALDEHMVILGRTGTGKSELIMNMAFGCAKAGESVVVIDPYGTLIDDLLEKLVLHCPERENDIVVLDFGDREHPPAFNPLDVDSASEIKPTVQTIESVLAPSMKLNGGSPPRSLGLALVAAAALCEANLRLPRKTPKFNLSHILTFLSDPDLRRLVVALSSNPLCRETFTPVIGFFEHFKPETQAELLMPLKQALSELMIADIPSGNASENLASPSQLISENKIVLVRTHRSQFNFDVGELLATLFLGSLWAGVERYSPRRNRLDSVADGSNGVGCGGGNYGGPANGGGGVRVFVDDMPGLFGVDAPIVNMISRGRRHGVGVIYSLQMLEQFPAKVEREVIGNTHSLAVFGCESRTSELAVRLLGPDKQDTAHSLRATDLTSIPNYRFVANVQLTAETLGHLPDGSRLPVGSYSSGVTALKGIPPQKRGGLTRTAKQNFQRRLRQVLTSSRNDYALNHEIPEDVENPETYAEQSRRSHREDALTQTMTALTDIVGARSATAGGDFDHSLSGAETGGPGQGFAGW